MAARCALILLLTFTCGLLADAAPPVCHGKEKDECCLQGWTFFQSRCFMFFSAELSWTDAELSCIDLGGNLASVHSLDDNDFLREHVLTMNGQYSDVWIGGHDGVKEGVWQWSDGSKFDFTHWADGAPYSSGNEDCVVMKSEDNEWKDQRCRDSLSFVCSARSFPKGRA